jgi:hypothetical protein
MVQLFTLEIPKECQLCLRIYEFEEDDSKYTKAAM